MEAGPASRRCSLGRRLRKDGGLSFLYSVGYWREWSRAADLALLALAPQGFFLEWLSKRLDKPDLVPLLNGEMEDGIWDDGAVLQRLLDGKAVGQLFREYRNSFSRSDDLQGEQDPPRPVPTHAA